MPGKTILEIPAAEQAQMLAQLRAARYGHLLALHVLLLSAFGLDSDRHRRRALLLADQCLANGRG